MPHKEGDCVIRMSSDEEAGENDELIIMDWVNIMNSQHQPGTSSRSRRRQIEKVPHTLRLSECNNKEYIPLVVSFGPYHHGQKDLQLAEEFKQTSLRLYASYCHAKSIEYLREKVLEVIDDIRDCYVEGSTNEYKDEELAEMMLLDGCLLLSIIEGVCNGDAKIILGYDHLGALGFSNMFRDMLLLENQLPYRILQLLMSIRLGREEDHETQENILNILDKAFSFYLSGSWSRSHQSDRLKATIFEQYKKRPPLHLLEIFRVYFVSICGVGYNSYRSEPARAGAHEQSVADKFDIKKYIHSFRSATEIKAKGIMFRPGTSKSETKNINFKSYCFYGKLEIPPFFIHEDFKSNLLNMIAYEMCPKNPNDFRVTSYVRFMKMLIQQPEDAKELRTNKIVLNSMGGSSNDEVVVKVFKDISVDETVAKFFKNMMAPDANNFVLDMVEDQIQRHYNSYARTWIAELITNHFSSPWTAIAFLAATALLVLAFIQTYYTIRPNNK